MTTDDRRPDGTGDDNTDDTDSGREREAATGAADAPEGAEGAAAATADATAEQTAGADGPTAEEKAKRKYRWSAGSGRNKRGGGSGGRGRGGGGSGDEEDDGSGGFLSHLVELRDRVMRMVLGIVVIFAVLFPFRETFYTYLAEPLMAHLPEGTSMIAIEVASPFLIPFKLTLFMAIFLAAPYILYQVWAFVAPGLYVNERRIIRPLIASSIVLFYTGIAFAYYIVFPLVFAFFTAVAPAGVEVMTDISRYLSFVITIFFAFGIAFQVPVATILLVLAGATTPEALASKRPYFIVAAFVVGMVLTPPDVISQTLLALPMWLLFEIGIWMSRLIRRRTAETAGGE